MRSAAILLSVAALLSFGAAHAGCTLEAAASLPVHAEDGRIFLSGSVNGHPVEFLVNPAYRSVALNTAWQGLTIGHGGDFTTVLGEERPTGPFGIVDEGPNSVTLDRMVYVKKGNLPNFGIPGAVVMLGADLLARFDVEFDLAHDLLVLYRPSGCDGVKEGYWDRQAQAADMLPNLGRPWMIVNVEPFTSYSFPYVTLSASVNGRPVRAAIDAGQRQSFLSLTMAHELGVDREDMTETDPTPDLFDGYSHRTWIGSFDTVTLGGETVGPVKLRVRSLQPAPGTVPPATGTLLREPLLEQGEMVLGADFLLTHRVLFSFSQHKVYFTRAGNRPFLGKEMQP